MIKVTSNRSVVVFLVQRCHWIGLLWLLFAVFIRPILTHSPNFYDDLLASVQSNIAEVSDQIGDERSTHLLSNAKQKIEMARSVTYIALDVPISMILIIAGLLNCHIHLKRGQIQSSK